MKLTESFLFQFLVAYYVFIFLLAMFSRSVQKSYITSVLSALKEKQKAFTELFLWLYSQITAKAQHLDGMPAEKQIYIHIHYIQTQTILKIQLNP